MKEIEEVENILRQCVDCGLDGMEITEQFTLAEEQLAGIDNLVLFRAKADRTVDVIATIKNEIEQPVAEE